VDDAYVKVAGRWTYFYRAIDQRGQIIDVLVCERRDATPRTITSSRANSKSRSSRRGFPGVQDGQARYHADVAGGSPASASALLLSTGLPQDVGGLKG
jgi:hypothetical protein